jgi:hypothetical protein
MAKFKQADVRAHIIAILREPTRKRRQSAAMDFTRELLGEQCTDPKFTMGQLLKLWNKIRFPR